MHQLDRLTLAFLLFAVLATAGCTARDGSSSDNDRQGTVYGGVTGGMIRP